jgi:hypothetical protein
VNASYLNDLTIGACVAMFKLANRRGREGQGKGNEGISERKLEFNVIDE